MTTIERIGQFSVVQHGHIFVMIDRKDGGLEVFTNLREAHEAAMERVDLVDGLKAARIH